VSEPLPTLPIAGGAPAEGERADARRNRERILCAAARLVERKGPDAVSMDAVAEEAGVGKGTLYRRFGDRASLLRALIEEPERELQESVLRGPPPLGPGAPPEQRLRAFGDALIDHLERFALHIWSAERDGGAGGPASRYRHPVYAFYRTHVAVLLRELVGEATRADFFAGALIAPLGAEPYLFERRVRGQTVEQLRANWHALADAILASARTEANGAQPSRSSATDR
jgi:AcrR family transcriptional regulator